jgi:hypothetical protein
MKVEFTIENRNIRTSRVAESNVFKSNITLDLTTSWLDTLKFRVNFRYTFKNFKGSNGRVFGLSKSY